jgi:acetyl esterase
VPVDPQIARLLADARAVDPLPLEALTVDAARARGGSVRLPPLPVEPIAETRDLATTGERAIALRLYRPNGGEGLPLLVYFHGGGWVIGSIATSDAFCRALANASGCAVVSVDYRLAPEHRYPAAAEDAYAATRWCADHARGLGADPDRLAVGGSSAGGNLAAVTALFARGRGGPRLALQWLHVPVLDHDFDTASYRANADGYGLTREGMRWFWDHYAPIARQRDEPHASPLRERDLTGLPPAQVITAECDPLRDEAHAYAERLRSAGVPVTYTEYAGMVHGFLSLAGVVPGARRALDEIGAALGRALA